MKQDLEAWNRECLDLENEAQAKAYLLAASHFLSNWPQEWKAKELAMVLLSEEGDAFFERRKEVFPWETIQRWCVENDSIDYDGFFELESLIYSLAEDIFEFAKNFRG